MVFRARRATVRWADAHVRPCIVIRYTNDVGTETAADLEGPFIAGWSNPPDPAMHLRLLQGSDHVVLAVHEGDDRIVGFVTAITDGVLAAYLPLLEVVDEDRGRGIGSELVRRLLDDLGPISMVDAMCDPELRPFYRHLGFMPSTGASVRNYSLQSGRN